jgi:arylsulfatase A-like enzyme
LSLPVTRRSFLAAAGASPLLAHKKKGPAAPKPNVVLVIADDLASWMLGCYGNQEILTPNLDRLALAGTRFSNSFCCTPAGAASRATLLSGRTPRQHGILDAAAPQGAAFANEVLASDVLSQAGYRCAYVGKWDLGNEAKPGHGISYSATLAGSAYQDPKLYVQGSAVDEKGYLTEILTRQGCQFIDQQKKGEPFFLTLGYPNPGAPYDGHPQKYYDRYANTQFGSLGIAPASANAAGGQEYLRDTVASIRRCAAATSALDDQIPVLQRKLIERGLFENTIFIFTSDNGFLLGRHGLWSDGQASTPANMYDEVMQVPMIWSWPGHIPISTIRPEMISFYDFLPALCEATGTEVPKRNLCGRSYLELALNHTPKAVWNNLVFGHLRDTEMARDARFKLVLRKGGEGPNELFEVRADPREMDNRYDEPGVVTVAQRLSAELASWRQRFA